MKLYYIQYNVGKSKYCVSFHDGIQKHDDGSPVFNLRIFKNKKNMAVLIKTLKLNGYTEKP